MRMLPATIFALGLATAANQATAQPAQPKRHERTIIKRMYQGPRLGVEVAQLSNELRTRLGLPAEGLVVNGVDATSAAGKAGVKVGDVITKVDGKKTNDAEDVWSALSSRKQGDKVAVELVRDKRNVTLQATIDASEIEEETEELTLGDMDPARGRNMPFPRWFGNPSQRPGNNDSERLEKMEKQLEQLQEALERLKKAQK